MASCEPLSAIRNFQLNDATYTDIICPYDCDYFEVLGSSDGSSMYRSSDGTDANGYQMPAGSWYSLGSTSESFKCGSPVNGDSGKTPRFPKGSVVCKLKAASGKTPKAIVEFLQ